MPDSVNLEVFIWSTFGAFILAILLFWIISSIIKHNNEQDGYEMERRKNLQDVHDRVFGSRYWRHEPRSGGLVEEVKTLREENTKLVEMVDALDAKLDATVNALDREELRKELIERFKKPEPPTFLHPTNPKQYYMPCSCARPIENPPIF